MRSILIGAALLLAACDAAPHTSLDPLGDAIGRADIVKKCAGGTFLGRDPRTGRFVFQRTGFVDIERGWVAPGVKPEDFCR